MMKLHLLLLLYCSCLNEVTNSAKQDLHTILSREDLRRFLDAESPDSVPDYDVTQVIHRRTKRSTHTSQKNLLLAAFGKDIELTLQRNRNIISKNGLTVERRTHEGLLSKETHFPKGKFYVGHTNSGLESHVALRETVRKGELRGTILMDGHIYQIKPLTDDVHKRASLNGSGYHVISRRSLKSTFGVKSKTSPILVKDEQIQLDAKTAKRDSNNSGLVYIEAMLTADQTTCHYYDDETLDYLLDIANLVSRLYKHASLGLNVNWALVKVFLVEGFDPLLDIATNHIRGAGQFLDKFQQWSSEQNTPQGTKGHFDVAALLTRRICGLEHCDLDGLAVLNSPCSDSGVSINEARGLAAAFTVAHEMAHNLGVGHDNGQDCAQGYIMNRIQSSGPNAFRWSPCSRQRMQQIFTANPCFHNKPPLQRKMLPIPPGYTKNRDKQCEMAHGPEYRVCTIPSLLVSCGLLYCATKAGGSCFAHGAPVAEGTVCGHRKWCIAGECSDVGSSLPPPQDGMWGPWSNYSACSRTCGGGIRYRSRKCNNPELKYFGKDCVGSSRGHYAMCNTKDCATGNFRQEQCEEHNTVSKKYKAHQRKGFDKCKLACVSGWKGYFFGNVKDSTRCGQGPFVYDVCVEGKCNKVGCDWQFGSEKVYDRCLLCGGNGSLCALTEATYTKNYRVYGPDNGDTMVIIPKGATNIEIREKANTRNYLTVVSNQTGQYYVRVTASSGTYYGAGTTISYSQGRPGDPEKISIRGPTNEALQAKFVYSGQQRNPGIHYSFYTPGKAKITKFIWKQEIEGRCSATCAGGVQRARVQCHREDDNTQVSPNYCDVNTRPADLMPCNQAPCPKQFVHGVWSPCSEKCGGGQQYRNLTCVQVVSKNDTHVLPDSECSHLSKPAAIQQCNNLDCLPEWYTGNWTQCSALCGVGTRYRQVGCRKKLGNGRWVMLARSKCNDFGSQKPDNASQCNAGPCFKWKVNYPCATCGDSDEMSYVPVGCFHDSRVGSRPLPELISSYRHNIEWGNINAIVGYCAHDTWKRQYPVFGVQFYAECWSGPFGHLTYDKDGFSWNGCWEGVGKAWNNFVYSFKNLVVEPIVDCINTITNQPVSRNNCSSPMPQARMKLCSHVCSNATGT